MPIVCGIHPVLEALNAGSRTIERVVVTKGVRNKRILEVIRKASERGVPLRFEPREALDRAADGERHQGVLAIVAEKGLLTLEDLQKSARTPALFMLLDGVEDPRNLGAIIRSVDAAGADGVILPDRHTASLSDAASRTAAGALESVKIARIGNVVQALETLKAKGFWIVGFDGSGKERWDAIDYKRPIVLVLGGEGKGIRRLVKEHCDHVVSLPVFGQVSSLNVSVAAGIALYEAVRQRGAVPTMARPIPPRALAAKKPVVIGPPPEDREEDPGARLRAAAIASLSAAPEPSKEAKAEAPAPEAIPAPLSLSMPGGGALLLPPEAGPSSPEPLVKEASLETVTGEHVPGTGGAVASGSPVDGGADDEDDEDDEHDVDPGSAAFARETADEGPEDEDREEDDENGEGGDEEEDDGDDDADEDDEEGGDEDYDEDDDEDDDEGEDDEDEDDGGPDEDDDDDDEEDEDDDDEDDDPGDESSELATPFMPEDNSGGGEVTWGSEKELHAHRPRREGERRFGNGGRRSGRPNDRKKKRRPQNGGGAPQPAANGEKTQGAPRDQNRDQQRRRREPNRGPRPPQNGPGGDPQNGRSGERPGDGNQPEGGGSTDAVAPANGQGQPGSDQNRDQNRPSGARRRNRRRRGGRGRSGGGERRPADPNAPPGQPGEGRPPREDRGRNPESQGPRGPRPESQGEGNGGGGEPRPGGEGAPREGGGGGGSEQGRRDRDRRRRRRRGRRGPGGSGGGPNRGGAQGGPDGGSREGGSSGGGGGDQGGSSGGGGSSSGSGGGNGGGSGGSDPS